MIKYNTTAMILSDFNIKTFRKYAKKLKQIIKEHRIDEIIYIGDKFND